VIISVIIHLALSLVVYCRLVYSVSSPAQFVVKVFCYGDVGRIWQLAKYNWQPAIELYVYIAQSSSVHVVCDFTAALDKEASLSRPLKSGMTYHFRSDSLLHSTALSAT